MKKILVFILLLAIIIGIRFFAQKKKADEIRKSLKKSAEISDGQLNISVFELVYNKNLEDTQNAAISIEDLISKYNSQQKEFNNYSFATLKPNNTISINNEHLDYSYDCSIIIENCKYKIVCFGEESSEFELGGC